MAELNEVGVRLTVQGSETSTAQLHGVRDAAAETTVALKSMGSAEVTSAFSAAEGGLTRAASATSALSTQLRTVDGHLRSVSGSLIDLSQSAVKYGAIGLVGLTAAVTGFGIAAASSFQQSRISFETMLGSVSRGDALFRQLQQFNLRTPFELPQITSATQTLLQYGFTGANVMPILQTLTNVASAAPAGMRDENLQRQALALGQISAAGVIRGQDINQLTQAGFPIIRLLQQVTGMSGPQLQAQLRGGGLTLPSSTLIDAIAAGGGTVLSPYADAAVRQSQSLSGQWSNFKDITRQNLATAAEPVVQRLTSELPQLTSSLDRGLQQIGPPLFRMVDALAAQLPHALDVAGPALGRFFTSVEAHGPQFVTFFHDVTTVGGDLAHVGADLLPVVDGLFKVFDGLLSLPFGDEAVAGLLITLLGYKALSSVVGSIAATAEALNLLADAEARAAFAGNLGTLTKVAGGAAGVAGLGYSGYESYQHGASLSNVLSGTLSGAVTGAVAGAPLFGIGAVPAAIGGAIIGGVGTYLLGEVHHHNQVQVVTAASAQDVQPILDAYYRDLAARSGRPGVPP